MLKIKDAEKVSRHAKNIGNDRDPRLRLYPLKYVKNRVRHGAMGSLFRGLKVRAEIRGYRFRDVDTPDRRSRAQAEMLIFEGQSDITTASTG